MRPMLIRRHQCGFAGAGGLRAQCICVYSGSVAFIYSLVLSLTVLQSRLSAVVRITAARVISSPILAELTPCGGEGGCGCRDGGDLGFRQLQNWGHPHTMPATLPFTRVSTMGSEVLPAGKSNLQLF